MLTTRAFSAIAAKPFRVGIVGAGVGGSMLAALLRKSSENVEVHVWEYKKEGELPAGFNLLFNHNHVASLEDADAELAASVKSAGTPYRNWTNRTFEGEVTMSCDVYAEGLSGDTEYGSILRWDRVCETLRDGAVAYGGGGIQYESQVKHHTYDDGTVVVDVNDEKVHVDMLVVSDGRYSKQRELAVGPSTHSLDHVRARDGARGGMANFRLTYENDGSMPELRTHDRLYNFPDVSRLKPGGEFAHLSAAAGASPSFEHVCMQGHARLGIMPLRSHSGRIDRYAAYGNFRFDGEIPPEAKTPEGLLAMYTPRGEADELGKFVLRGLAKNADHIYWARMQRSDTHYRDARGGVLLIGDAASGFFPSLGQGAGAAIEDASCAANVILGALEKQKSRGGSIDVAACTQLVDRLRRDRRDFIADLSDVHTAHMIEGGRDALDAFESEEWRAERGRKALTQLWAGFPLAKDSRAAAYAL